MDTFLPDDVGKVMNLNGTWSEVLSVLNPKKVVVAPALVGTGYLVTDLVNMNRLVVTPLTTMSITKFEVEHKHTFE